MPVAERGAGPPELVVTAAAKREERWPRLYAVVLGVLALEIAGLWLLARAFPA